MDNKDYVYMSDVKDYIKRDKNPHKRFRKIARIIIIIFLILIIIPYIVSIMNTYIFSDNIVTNRAIEDNELYNVGDTVSSPLFDITVTDIIYPTPYNDINNYKNKNFVQINVAIKNTSDKKQTTSLTMDCFVNNIKGIEKNEQGKTCKNNTLKAKETKNYTYIFSVPKDKTDMKIKIYNENYYYDMNTTYEYWYKYTLIK